MEDEEVDVQALLQRTRRNRENLNKHLAEIGESPKNLRSPLRDVSSTNVTISSPSKTKTSYSKSSSFSSPTSSPSKQTSFERAQSFETSASSQDNKRETFTKTTITEREEKFHKTEVVKFTEVRGGSSTPISSNNRMRELAAKFDVYVDPVENSATTEENLETPHLTKKVTFLTPSKLESSVTESPRNDNRSIPVEIEKPKTSEEVPIEVPNNVTDPTGQSSGKVHHSDRFETKNTSGEVILTPARREVELDDIGESGRRRRFAQLANKFKDYDASPGFNDSNASITKEVDVDEELSREPSPTKNPASPVKTSKWIRSPTKATSSPSRTPRTNVEGPPSSDGRPTNLNKDPGFISKLKAQGFEETSSKSKLVYDFKTNSNKEVRNDDDVSAQKLERLPSPKKHDNGKALPRTGLSPVRQSPLMKSHSPPSPFKPHPLQFVSPQVNEAIARAKSPSPSRNPVKPPRTFEDDCETEKNDQDATNTDTASRRTMGEKKTMFEDNTPRPSPSMDPSMLSLSQRRALFEKRGSTPLPKPVARFGEPVTPAMLQKRSPIRAGVGERKREASRSPVRSFAHAKKTVDETHKWVKDETSEEEEAHHNQRIENDTCRPSSPKRSPPKFLKEKNTPKSPLKTTGDEERLHSERSRVSPVKSPEKEMASSQSSSKQVTLGSNLGWKRRLEQSTPSAKKQAEEMKSSTHATPKTAYPGVGSLKRLKVSPPKEGQLYPQVEEESSRPSTSMSNEGSEAPSLGAVIRKVAISNALPSHAETESEDESMECDDLGEMLDEALDSEANIGRSVSSRTLQSAVSWEYHTPIQTTTSSEAKRFKTPTVDAMEFTPPSALPHIDDENNASAGPSSSLTHTVSFYRRMQSSATTPQSESLVQHHRLPDITEDEDNTENERSRIQSQIRQLKEEAYKQQQQMEQASKALNFCVTRDEFEGSSERVEGERLLLEATHKHGAIMAEIRRLSTDGAIGHEKKGEQKGSKGTICISGLGLPMKGEFIRLVRSGGDEFVHFFVVLVKHRSRVIATQMLSSMDARERGKLSFPNLIKLNDLDLDFQIYVEVYGLQTRREHLTHEEKFGLRKDKSVFNLTPLKKKRQDSSHMHRHANPVNDKTIRRPAFGLVGYAVLNLTTLKSRAFYLEKVPELSPLQGDLEMTLTIHSESTHKKRGFLTLFSEAHGYGDWLRRWCRLDRNALFFWKYPEDEKAKKEPLALIHLSQCITDNVSLAPREICSRMNTFMLETKRETVAGDKSVQDSLVISVDEKRGLTKERHLLSADSRDERLEWCEVLNSALHNIRAWDPKAFRPRPQTMESDASSTDGNTDTLSSVSTEV